MIAGTVSSLAGSAMGGMGLMDDGMTAARYRFARTMIATGAAALTSRATGGDVLQGALTGATVHLFNHEAMRNKGYDTYFKEEERFQGVIEKPVEDWQPLCDFCEIPVTGKFKLPLPKSEATLSEDLQLIERDYSQFELYRVFKIEIYKNTNLPTGYVEPTLDWNEKPLGNFSDREYGIRGCFWSVCGSPYATWGKE